MTTTKNYYRESTDLLATPKVKLTNRTRKDLARARVAFASQAPLSEEMGETRSSRRRIKRASAAFQHAANQAQAEIQRPLSQPTEARQAARLARKDIYQLCNSIRRGLRRSVKLSNLAERNPDEASALLTLSAACKEIAVAAQGEVKRRISRGSDK